MARRKRRQWGMGSVHQTARGWAIRWRENGRQRSRAGFATREDAERVLAKVLGDLAMDRAGMPPDKRGLPDLNTLAEPWLERRLHTHPASWAAMVLGHDSTYVTERYAHIHPEDVAKRRFDPWKADFRALSGEGFGSESAENVRRTCSATVPPTGENGENVVLLH